MPWISRPGYTTAQRRTVLRAQPTCQCRGCAHCAYGCAQPSAEVDHIISRAALLRAGDPDPDRLANAQGLCAECHAIKTADERQLGQEIIAKKARHPCAPPPGLL